MYECYCTLYIVLFKYLLMTVNVLYIGWFFSLNSTVMSYFSPQEGRVSAGPKSARRPCNVQDAFTYGIEFFMQLKEPSTFLMNQWYLRNVLDIPNLTVSPLHILNHCFLSFSLPLSTVPKPSAHAPTVSVQHNLHSLTLPLPPIIYCSIITTPWLYLLSTTC